MKMAAEMVINGREITPGLRLTLELPLPPLYTHTPITMPVHIVRGKKDGPRLFVSAAIHGDELNGVEVIRRLLQLPVLSRLHGTLIAVPIVNVYGVIHNSRYLPDRRDLNRSFPGSEKGSLAARCAVSFMDNIVRQCTHGIDLHTGALHRSNLPQIRTSLDREENLTLARAFGAPVILDSTIRDGSLREAAAAHGIPILIYESGQALRFDEPCIRAGVRGVVNVMRTLGMLPKTSKLRPNHEPMVARSSSWVRAPASGLMRSLKSLGETVNQGDLLGLIDDIFDAETTEVRAAFSGIIIGRSEIPLVHEGGAVFHVARFAENGEAVQNMEICREKYHEEDMPYMKEEPEIS
jgi:uncharacterized protein